MSQARSSNYGELLDLIVTKSVQLFALLKNYDANRNWKLSLQKRLHDTDKCWKVIGSRKETEEMFGHDTTQAAADPNPTYISCWLGQKIFCIVLNYRRAQFEVSVYTFISAKDKVR